MSGSAVAELDTPRAWDSDYLQASPPASLKRSCPFPTLLYTSVCFCVDHLPWLWEDRLLATLFASMYSGPGTWKALCKDVLSGVNNCVTEHIPED